MSDPSELLPVERSQPLVELKDEEDTAVVLLVTKGNQDEETRDSHQDSEHVEARRGKRCCSVPDHLQPLPVKRDGELYGREKQSAKLNEAYKRRSGSNVQELILLTGTSGTGKTSLARTLKPRIHLGKVRPAEEPRAFAPFIAAFTELASLASAKDVNQLRMQMDTDIDQQLLLHMIPALDVVLVDDASPSDSSKNPDDTASTPVQHVAILSDNLSRRFLVA